MTTPPEGITPPGGPPAIRAEPPNAAGTFARRLLRPAQVIIVSSVMFTFISYWRTAAVVLCDLASTSYYIGGIVEQSIGSAAPWFILAVMFFSYAVRSVYIESCTLFVRGGVYRVVREALGKFMAKLAVSALMFDYILTGPISAVSGGQYIIGLVIEILTRGFGMAIDENTRDLWKRAGSVLIATAATLYFFRKNIIGIHESSEKALKIMVITTIMGAVMLTWCCVTLAVNGPAQSQDNTLNRVSLTPDFNPKLNPTTKEMEDPTGFLKHTSVADKLRDLTGKAPADWLGLIGVFGIFIAFGHSILAMSGEETLAQVYREVESPKLKNFKKAAFIVFVYSLLLTGGISFLAVLLIPNDVRMSDVLRQPDRRPGHERRRPVVGPIAAQRLRGRGRLPDPVRRGQHGDHRLQRRPQSRRRGRRHAGMVPQAPSALRHDLPHPLAHFPAATVHHLGQPRRRAAAGRGVRFRRRLELRLPGAGDGGAALHRSPAARGQGAAERPRRQVRGTDRSDPHPRHPRWCRRCATC